MDPTRPPLLGDPAMDDGNLRWVQGLSHKQVVVKLWCSAVLKWRCAESWILSKGCRTRNEISKLTDQKPQNLYEEIKPRLHKRIGREVRLARRVLDLGCGSCDLVKHLADTYDQDVTGVDVSGGSFPSSRRTHHGCRFHCRKRNAANMTFAADGSVDAVVTMWALHEMAEPRAVLREVRRVLRPGGEIFVMDFPKDSLAQQLWNEDYYTPKEVEILLVEAGFKTVQVQLIEHQQMMWARGHQPRVVSKRGS